MYARWIWPHPTANSGWSTGFPDGSAHRIISDLSAFIGNTDPGTHRILAAGDLNTIYGATDDNQLALPARDRTITDRLDALGMEFLGPQFPAGPHPRDCQRPPKTCPHSTRRANLRRLHRISWTMSFPHVVFTKKFRSGH